MKKSTVFLVTMPILSVLSLTLQAQFPQWMWTNAIASPSITFWDYTANDIIETPSGDLVIAGSKTVPGRSIVYVARMNGEGDNIWTRSYPAIGINVVEFNEDAPAITPGHTSSGLKPGMLFNSEKLFCLNRHEHVQVRIFRASQEVCFTILHLIR